MSLMKQWFNFTCSLLALWAAPLPGLFLDADTARGRLGNQVRVLQIPRGQPFKLRLPLPADVQSVADSAALNPLLQATSLSPSVISVSTSVASDRRRLFLQTGSDTGFLHYTVDVACHAPGKAYVRLDFAPYGGQLGFAPMLLAKTCTAGILRGFNVGQVPQGGDAVRDGQPQWTKTHKPEIGFNVREMTLYVSMTGNNIGLQFAAPTVRTTILQRGPDVLPDEPIVEVLISSNLHQGKLLAAEPKSVRLGFRCLHAGTTLIELILSPGPVWDPYKPVSIWMTKICGGQAKTGFAIGSESGANDLVVDGIVLQHPSNVDSITDTSSFYVKYPPNVATDVDQVPTPRVRCGLPQSGMQSDLLRTQLGVYDNPNEDALRYIVSYSCIGRGIFECTFDLNLPLWNSPHLRWQKQCGGDARPDIIVHSSLDRFSNVFGNGHPLSAWASSKPQVWLLPEEEDVSFEFRRRGNSKALLLRLPEVYSSDPSVVTASLMNSGIFSGRVLAKDLDEATLLVHHVCNKHGSAMVTLNLPTEDWDVEQEKASLNDLKMFGPVSFSYMKSCGKKETASVILAGWFSMASVSILGFVGFTAYTMLNCMYFSSACMGFLCQ